MNNNQSGNLAKRLTYAGNNQPQVVDAHRVYAPEQQLARRDNLANRVVNRRNFLQSGALLALGLAGTKYLTGCVAPPSSGLTPQQWNANTPWEKLGLSTVDYGAIDDYVKACIDNKDIGVLAQGVVFYPADFTFDLIRSIGYGLVDVPNEAMKRSRKEKSKIAIATKIPTEKWAEETGINPVGYGKKEMNVLWIPIEAVLGVAAGTAELVVDSARFTKNYLLVSVGGIINHAKEKPLETLANAGTWVAIGSFIKRNTHNEHTSHATAEAYTGPPLPKF